MTIAIVWLLYSHASAQEAQCISERVRAELAECPGGLERATGALDRRPPPPIERPREERRRARAPEQRLDPIETPRAPRTEEILLRELGVLRRLGVNVRPDDPRRPDVLLRLAETLFELQGVVNATVHGFDEPLHRARTSRDAARVRALARDQSRVEARLQATREELIRTYATLVTDHATHARADEVLYSLAVVLEQIGQRDRARAVYLRLVRDHSGSRFVPYAFLAFAERAFDEGSFEDAAELYRRALEFPPERNPMYGYALYKSAWALYNLEDFGGSLDRFVRAIELESAHPDQRDVANIARQARRELVLPYARSGSPNRALDFFRRIAPNEDAAFEIYESLAELYFDTGEWPNAISVYQGLLAQRSQSDRTCWWQSRIANAILSSRPRPDQLRELVRLADLRELYLRGRHDASALSTCNEETATLVIGTAVAWHREAIGTNTQPGTNDRATMRMAGDLYALALRSFPDLDRIEFRSIDRRDRPTEYGLRYYQAELLWKMERFEDCGPAFDRVVELDPAGAFSTDAALAAVLCYDRVWQTTFEPRDRQVLERESLAPRSFTPLEERMNDAFARYACVVTESDDLATVEYRRARLYYEANRFDEAAVLFRNVFERHPRSELAIYAANLYLDSLNVMGSMLAEPRRACLAELRGSLDPLHQTFCSGASSSDLCGTLDRLQCDVLRKDAEALAALGRHAEAARAYVGIYRDHPSCGDSEYRAELLYDAGIHFEAARLLGRAIQVRQVLVERHAESSHAPLATYQVGANYHALAIYSQAASWYERFARAHPREDGSRCLNGAAQPRIRAALEAACREAVAPDALRNAVFFRLGLGEEEAALEDAELFERNYARALPRESASVFFSIGSIYERQGVESRVIEHYRRFLQRYQRSALPQDVLRAHVAIGRALEETDERRAEDSFRDAVRAFEGGARDAIAALPEAEREAASFAARDAVSEALFHLAESDRRAFDAIAFPAYRGGRSVERVNEWARTDFAAWIEEKRVAITRAEEAYSRIASLDVPNWEIAAASRIGTMYRTLTDQFREAPVPAIIEQDPVALEIYERVLDEASEPFLATAVERFEYCLVTATRVRWFNEHSRACEVELHRLEPGRYPLAAELRSAPDHVYDADRRGRAADLASLDRDT